MNMLAYGPTIGQNDLLFPTAKHTHLKGGRDNILALHESWLFLFYPGKNVER